MNNYKLISYKYSIYIVFCYFIALLTDIPLNVVKFRHHAKMFLLKARLKFLSEGQNCQKML